MQQCHEGHTGPLLAKVAFLLTKVHLILLCLYAALKPEVVILDIRFGEELTGLDAAKQILVQDTKAKIIFLSQFD